MKWVLRYAPHLGHLARDRKPLFSASADPDPVSQVRFAAAQGLAGVLDAWAVDHPPDRLDALESALKETGLTGGCICLVPFEALGMPLWVSEKESPELLQHLDCALHVAQSLRSQVLAVLLIAEQGTPLAIQRRRAIDRLRRAGDTASARGITLAVEAFDGLSGMLLSSFSQAVDLVHEVNHPGVKLIYDTGHVAAFGEPILESYIEAYDDIAVLQLSDMPGRIEPGAGTIDFVPLIAHAIARGYSGLVELEYHWSAPSLEAEERALQALHTIETQALALVGNSCIEP